MKNYLKKRLSELRENKYMTKILVYFLTEFWYFLTRSSSLTPLT